MATIKNTRDIGLQSRGVNYRIMKPTITIASYSTSPAGLSYFSKPANSTTLVPASLTLLVTDSFSPGNYSVPVYNWEYSTSADPTTFISLGVNTLSLTITNTNFAIYAGTGNFVNFKLTVSQAGWTTSTQIYVVEYYRTLAITPVVSLSRSDIILPVSTVGVINYTGTGTNIRVSINNVNIPYDVAGTAGPNTFTVTAVGSTTPNTVTVGAATTTTTTVANDTRTFADISGLTATVNPGSIVYTITVRDADGTVSVFTRTQSVVVSLTGASGNSVFVATVYQQNASAPATPVATSSSYNFSTNVLTPPAGWSVIQPATTTTPTYACNFTFSGAAGTTVTGTGNWSTPYIEAVNGTNGANGTNGEFRDTIQLYLAAATLPTVPTSVQYTFTGNVLGTVTGGTAGWSMTQPATTTTPTYIIKALAVTTTPGTAVNLTSWSSPVIVAQNGSNAKALSITADSYIFKADTNNTIAGAIKLTANKQNTTNTVTWATVPGISLHSLASGGTVVTTGDIVYLQSASYSANTSVTVTATIAADSLTDTTSILRVKDGSLAITAILNNPVVPLPTTAAGVVTYTGSGTTIQVYEGSTLRTITAVTSTATGITRGTISGLTTTTVTIGDHSVITQDNAKIIYTVTITRGDGSSANIDVTQSLTKSKAGADGTNGTSNITVSAFKWAIGTAPTATGSATFTWSSKTYDTPPSGWTSAATAAPATGYTLYQVNLIVSAVSTATTTAINWANGTVGIIGFRQDGSIGLTGDSHKTAYVVTTSGTAPGSVTAGTGNVAPTNAVANQVTGWNFNATSNLAPGQYMYQVDGTYTNGANITWGNPYLSNLKVGSLEAISANMGTLTSGTINGGIINGGTITGSLIQTAASGQRVVIDSTTNILYVYNSSGTNTLQLGGSSGGQVYVDASAAGSTSIIASIAGGFINNSTTYPALIAKNNNTATQVFDSAAGLYAEGVANHGVFANSTKDGVGVFGYARRTGGTNHGVRGVNVAQLNAAGTGVGNVATSGLIGASNGYDFYADGGGTNYGPFTGAHDVLVPVAQNVPVGYIVCDVQLVVAKNISNTVFKVAMSTVANQAAIGIMAVNNGLLANVQPAAFIEKVEWIGTGTEIKSVTIMLPEYDVVKDLYNYCAVNAVGEGQVYVCGESGNISAGDLIVTSSVAGVGMKQSDNIVRNVTVAKARQAVTFTDVTTPVLVACIYLCG